MDGKSLLSLATSSNNQKLPNSYNNHPPRSKLAAVAWVGPLERINALALCWEIISQLGPLSKCDLFNCRIQKA